MKARIICTIGGTTKDLTVEGHRISRQLWPSGLATIAIRDPDGQLVRTLGLRHTDLIDIDHTGTRKEWDTL